MLKFLRRFPVFTSCSIFAVAFWCANASIAQHRDYLLGPGDSINIKVFETPDLSVEARVSGKGVIAYPLLGDVQVAGLSTADAAELIAARLRDGNFVRKPVVSIAVSAYRSLQISVLGQVAKPGKYAMEQSATPVTEAIAIAGGLLPAAADVVWLVRRDGDQERKIELDIPEILRTGELAKDQRVQNGDTIFVPRAPYFYIYGEAQRPGQYRIERNMNVMQALAAGGGPTTRGTDRALRITRRENGGKLVTREADPNELMQPDDVLHVRERLF